MVNWYIREYGKSTGNRYGITYTLDEDKKENFLGFRLETNGTEACFERSDVKVQYISEILSDGKFDTLKDYVPRILKNELIVPHPFGTNGAETSGFNFSDGTVKGSTAFPSLYCISDTNVVAIETLLLPVGGDGSYHIFSYWSSSHNGEPKRFCPVEIIIEHSME